MFYITDDPSYPLPYFHWVLCLTDHPFWQDPDGITVCEIVRGADAWKNHFSKLGVEELMKSREFVGIVEICTTESKELSLLELKDWFWATTAKDNGFQIAGPTGWTCATWCLRCLVHLREGDLITMRYHNDSLYRQVLASGEDLRQMMDDGSVEGAFPVMIW